MFLSKKGPSRTPPNRRPLNGSFARGVFSESRTLNLYLKYVLAANAFCTGKLMTIATQITTRVVIIMVSSIVSNNLAVHSQYIETVHDPASGAARCELACSSPREAESLEPKWRGYNSILIASTPPPPDLRLQAFKPPNTIKGRRQGTKPHK